MNSLKLYVLQHTPSETLGIIGSILENKGISAQYIRAFAEQPLPRGMADAAGLIVLGGPMGVYEHPRYPFLREEMRLLEQSLKEGKPVLGICLGSQLLAATLGASVTKGKKKEIGWYPVKLTPSAQSDSLWQGVEPSFVAYHWHGDLFTLPQGAISLASSEQTEYQAFRYGLKAYGFLFHLEVTEKIIQDMVQGFVGELPEAGVDGGEILGKAQEQLPHLHRIGGLIFPRWASLAERG